MVYDIKLLQGQEKETVLSYSIAFTIYSQGRDRTAYALKQKHGPLILIADVLHNKTPEVAVA